MSIYDRRQVLRFGASAMVGAVLSRFAMRDALADGAASVPAAGGAQSPIAGTAKAVIVLYMNGGPSHIDTWDPKPGAATGGPHKAIKTRTAGLQISEHMPRLADMSDKFAVVRSMSSKEGNHQRAQYLLRTGYAPNPTVIHPSLGGWVSKKLGEPKNGLPAFVSLGGPSLGAGFLGVQYGPFVLPKPGLPANVTYGVDTDQPRFERRLGLLDAMEQRFSQSTGDAKVEGRRALSRKSVALMHTPDLSAFDLSKEEPTRLASFGDTDFGRGCATAARLVEKGVRCVEVMLDGWDTHKDNFNRVKTLMGTLDAAMSSLITELSRRNLLDSTLIVWMGDFGRTPRINGNEGRDHYPQAWSTVLAGAGIKKGQVYGETDANGEKVTKDLVSVPNLAATIATVLGMDPSESFLSPVGRPIALTDSGAPINALLA